jgi:hypothetical protein
MSDPAPKAPSPKTLLGAGVAFIGSGTALAAVGQTVVHQAAMSYAGLALLAVGLVFVVISQKGK